MRRRALYASAALLAIAVGACCSIPTYTPAFWNSTTQVQWYNNCYNYSNNKRTDTFAQPGRAAGAQWTAKECNNVKTAAVADGLVAVAGPDNCPKKECTLALVVDPGTDCRTIAVSPGPSTRRGDDSCREPSGGSEMSFSHPNGGGGGPAGSLK